jgi:hypothetical protein
MSHFDDIISYAIGGPAGELETDEQMAHRIAYQEEQLAKWDQAAADARIALIEAFLEHAERVGFSYGGTEGDDGLSEARGELDRLRSGPPKVNRERQRLHYLNRKIGDAFKDVSAYRVPDDASGVTTIETVARTNPGLRATIIEADGGA